MPGQVARALGVIRTLGLACGLRVPRVLGLARALGLTCALQVTRVLRTGSAPRRGPRSALLAAAALMLITALFTGCGESIELPDLFVVQRSGGAPGAKLTVVVNEGGAVHCKDGSAKLGPTRQLSDPQLVLARGLQEELQSPSAKHLTLAARPGSVFSYYVRDAEGTVRFADNSTGQTSVLRHLAYFVLEVAQRVCHLSD